MPSSPGGCWLSVTDCLYPSPAGPNGLGMTRCSAPTRSRATLDLLDAFAPLSHDLATLHLVGRTDVDWCDGVRVARRLARPDVAERVVVHGPVSRERLADLYGSADVFVLPSYREPYGTVYGEAMAAGLPAVGRRAGKPPARRRHGREALVLDPRGPLGPRRRPPARRSGRAGEPPSPGAPAPCRCAAGSAPPAAATRWRRAAPRWASR
jgi:hypothetical protein